MDSETSFPQRTNCLKNMHFTSASEMPEIIGILGPVFRGRKGAEEAILALAPKGAKKIFVSRDFPASFRPAGPFKRQVFKRQTGLEPSCRIAIPFAAAMMKPLIILSARRGVDKSRHA